MRIARGLVYTLVACFNLTGKTSSGMLVDKSIPEEVDIKPLNEFCCVNRDCKLYGKRGKENLGVHQTFGKSDTIGLLECNVCGTRFSERAHTALSQSRLPKDKVISILHHFAEGCGQRQTCRLVGVSRAAVSRLTRIAGNHAKTLHDELVTDVKVTEAQADEKWCFVGKKRQDLQRGG